MQCWHQIWSPPVLLKSKLNVILFNDFNGLWRFYTDGSKAGAAVAAAAMSDLKLSVKHLPNNSSIFSAVAHGILLALSIIEFLTFDRFFILKDSVFCLVYWEPKTRSSSKLSFLSTNSSFLVNDWIPLFVVVKPCRVCWQCVDWRCHEGGLQPCRIPSSSPMFRFLPRHKYSYCLTLATTVKRKN